MRSKGGRLKALNYQVHREEEISTKGVGGPRSGPLTQRPYLIPGFKRTTGCIEAVRIISVGGVWPGRLIPLLSGTGVPTVFDATEVESRSVDWLGSADKRGSR